MSASRQSVVLATPFYAVLRGYSRYALLTLALVAPFPMILGWDTAARSLPITGANDSAIQGLWSAYGTLVLISLESLLLMLLPLLVFFAPIGIVIDTEGIFVSWGFGNLRILTVPWLEWSEIDGVAATGKRGTICVAAGLHSSRLAVGLPPASCDLVLQAVSRFSTPSA